MELATTFDQIRSIVSQSWDTETAWQQVLDLVGENQVELTSARPSDDAESVVAQLQRVFSLEIPPPNLSFFYFGLFESVKEVPVLYVSGSSHKNHQEALDENRLDYFPKNRFLKSSILESVARAKSFTKMKLSTYDYLLQFGAAGVVVKGASDRLALRIPVYVGFDSGDYAKVRD